MTRTAAACLLALASLVTAPTVSAAPITFSFDGDAADWPWIGRSFLPGTVTGVLYGLADDGLDQTPTAVEFTSDVSALGMTQTFFGSFNFVGGPGFDVVGGSVVDASILINITDPSVSGVQLRFNFESRNVLHWNGGGGPVSGLGNANGFAGASFGVSAPVPEPASMALLGVGMLGFGALRGIARRRPA